MYQPNWNNGKEEGSGYRDCAIRYHVLAGHVAGLGRGFTVLDVGANSGYFSLRLTEDFSAKCTAVDSEPSLRKAEGKIERVIGTRFGSADEIRALGPFDVVLCLSVLHHVPWWREMLDAALEISSRLYVETPHPDEYLDGHVVSDPEVYHAVSALNGEILCRTEGNPSPTNPFRELSAVRGLRDA